MWKPMARSSAHEENENRTRDTDDAWRHAEVFVAEQMTTLDVDK
jgi:hypothetical protein